METREILLQRLNETIWQLLGVCQNMTNPEIAVYEGWTAKDILGHITFWHESFARNVSEIVNDIKPTPLTGRYRDLNRRCLDEMRAQAGEDVIKRLEVAHKVIQESILNAKLILIPYKKGSRDYTPEEHLDIVNKHLQEHLRDIEAVSKET
jgi:hypothetical protein